MNARRPDDLSALPEFRYFYSTPRYEETVAFYRRKMGLDTWDDWDRNIEDRGTLFLSPNGVGIIEVVYGAQSGPAGGLYIEMEDVDAWFEELTGRGVPIDQPLTDTHYGHRQFTVVDPSGLTIGFFAQVER